MRYKVIACKVFTREISLLAARSSSVIDVTWLPQGLHNYPSLLREAIQTEIDRVEAPSEGPSAVTPPPEEYAAIILAFGLCSRALAGLRSRRFPLVIPRSHDCIALLLGSHEKYRKEFAAQPGTYWFSPGWIEQSTFPCGAQSTLMKERLAKQYGEENADYLVQLQRDSLRSYTRAALISWPELDRPEYYERVRQVARDFDWDVATIEGEPGFLSRILDGDWREQEALICPPGRTLEAGNEDEVVRSVACSCARSVRSFSEANNV